jgi:exodeoxyribonuclease V gamma subunit
MPLARRLAQLFDSYQTYRPDLLDDWQEGRDEQSPWQADLWRKLIADDSGADRASLLRTLIARLREESPSDLPARISILGESVVPPIYLEFLSALSRHVSITWYTVGVVSETEHPLVTLLGEDAREAEQLRKAKLPLADVVSKERSKKDLQVDSVLGRLQTDLRTGAVNIREVDDFDDSLRIHDCHSPIRELEVIRDQILDAFETIEDLRPSDVLIAVPDLDRYGTLVDAVFSAGDELQRLPVTIAHDPREQGRRYLTAFISLLDLLQSRVTAGAVLELLSEPAIGRRAEIDSEGVDVIRWWIRETHIRWGTDGVHREAFGLPADELHTWKHGLDRLLMGMLSGESDDLIDSVLPFAEATLDRSEILGRFAAFIQALSDARLDVAHLRRLEAWRDDLQLLAATIMLAEGDDEQLAEDHLFGILREMAMKDPSLETGFSDIVDHLKSALLSFEGRGRLLAGAITVADFERLRYIPARVIACVGLNDDAFPRASMRADFDLIASNRSSGDPDVRRLDKQLFLDAIGAAKDRLILTFLGRSQKDNSERASSIVVDALLETLASTYRMDAKDIRENLVVEHPLQPFSARYFDGSDPRLFSYDRTNCIEPADRRVRIEAFASAPLQGVAGDAEVIQLDDLIAAWSHPGKFFCERLGVRLKLSDTTVEDHEPLFMDGLDSFRIGSQIVDGTLAGQSPDEIRERLRHQGDLPAGALGEQTFESEMANVRPLLDIVAVFGEMRSREVDITIGERRLVGSIPRVSDSGTLLFRPASIKPKDRVAAWIYHLAVAVGDPAWTTYFVGKEFSTYYQWRWSGVKDAESYLEELVAGYGNVLATPPLVLPSSSYELVSGNLDKALETFEGGFFSGDCDDSYVSLMHRHSHPIRERLSDFEREARWLFGPIEEYVTREKP